MLVATGGLVTLVAHGSAMGHGVVTVRSIGLVAALSMLAALSVAVRPRRVFRERGVAALLIAQLVLQGVLHAAMGWAPWAFGLPPHQGGVVIDESAFVAHLIAALVLALLCLGVDRLLAAALEAIAFLRRLITPPEPGAQGSPRYAVLAVTTASAEASLANPAAPRAPPV